MNPAELGNFYVLVGCIFMLLTILTTVVVLFVSLLCDMFDSLWPVPALFALLVASILAACYITGG